MTVGERTAERTGIEADKTEAFKSPDKTVGEMTAERTGAEQIQDVPVPEVMK